MSILHSIRKQLKKAFELIKNRQLKENLLQATPFWIASLVTGLIAVLYSKLFSGAEAVSMYLLHHFQWWLLLISPSLFLIAYYIVAKYAPYSRGSGIPQVIASLELSTPREYIKVRSLLSIKVIVIKICSSLLAAMGGAAIGREGPTIQIAASVFRKVNQWIPDSWPKISRRNMIMTGAAAGLAAAFNTPLGGIVFAVEELTRTHISYFRIAIFSSVIIAGLTAQSLLGPYLYLGYPDVSNLHVFSYIGVVIAAIVTGIIGSLMCKVILYVLHRKRKFTLAQNLFYAAACSMILITLALIVSSQTMGSGKEVMNTMLFSANKRSEWYMPLLRILGPILSFTTGVAGGVFAPALSAGATFGSIIAEWLHLSPTDTNLLILSGMVGFLTGVTRTPFTSAILVLEMTDRHNVIFHLMLAGMVASLVSLLVDKESFYDHMKDQYLHTLRNEVPEQNVPGPNPANA